MGDVFSKMSTTRLVQKSTHKALNFAIEKHDMVSKLPVAILSISKRSLNKKGQVHSDNFW